MEEIEANPNGTEEKDEDECIAIGKNRKPGQTTWSCFVSRQAYRARRIRQHADAQWLPTAGDMDALESRRGLGVKGKEWESLGYRVKQTSDVRYRSERRDSDGYVNIDTDAESGGKNREYQQEKRW